MKEKLDSKKRDAVLAVLSVAGVLYFSGIMLSIVYISPLSSLLTSGLILGLLINVAVLASLGYAVVRYVSISQTYRKYFIAVLIGIVMLIAIGAFIQYFSAEPVLMIE